MSDSSPIPNGELTALDQERILQAVIAPGEEFFGCAYVRLESLPESSRWDIRHAFEDGPYGVFVFVRQAQPAKPKRRRKATTKEATNGAAI